MTIYTASASATAFASDASGIVFTSSASATATSTLSYEDAYQIAYNTAYELALTDANASAGITTSTGGTRNHDNTQVYRINSGINMNDEFVDVGNNLTVKGSLNLEFNVENYCNCSEDSENLPTIDNIENSGNSNNNSGTRNHDQLQLFGKNLGFNINDEFLDIGNDLTVDGDFNIIFNIKYK
jgi:hypothetical protein